MEANLFEKIGIILKNSTSSILFLEIDIIFVLIFLFLLFNLRYKRKEVPIFLTLFLLYFLCSVLVLFHKELSLATRSLVKKMIEYFYFSPIPVYFLTVFVSSYCLVKTIFEKRYTKRHKVISYLFLLPIFFFFTSFVILSFEEKLPIHEITSFYQNETILSLLQVSQFFFFTYLLTCLFRALYHRTKSKIVK